MQIFKEIMTHFGYQEALGLLLARKDCRKKQEFEKADYVKKILLNVFSGISQGKTVRLIDTSDGETKITVGCDVLVDTRDRGE